MNTWLITCRACHQELPVDAFYQSAICLGAQRGLCRSCSVKKTMEWNAANSDRARLNALRCHRTLESKAKSKQWRQSNKPYLAEVMKQWRIDNPDQWKAITKRGRRKNIEKILVRNREREIREVTAMPPWADRTKIQSIYLEAKRLTRETGILHEVDHIYPLRGRLSCGLHVEHNLQIIPGAVNRRKFNKMPEEFVCSNV